MKIQMLNIKNMKKQAGTTLIEVLVAVVVVSIGLVGLAALQTLSLKNNHSAYMRTQASILVYSMVDRMRANQDEAVAGSYVKAYGAPTSTVDCNTNTATCSPSDMAIFDINEWKCSLGNWDTNNTCSSTFSITGMLPSGDGRIIQAGNIHTVEVTWNDRDGSQQIFQVSTEL